MPRFTTQATPNPNSMKITTSNGSFIDDGMRAFSTAEEAEDDPIGQRLFAIGGVADVFVVPDFLTITKSAGASWNLLMPKVKSALASYFEEERA